MYFDHPKDSIMKILKPAIPFLGAFILTSCGLDGGSGGGRMETTNVPRFSVSNSTVSNNSDSQSTNSVTSGFQATKLNPAHGLPGHRCDIAVGAPLPSTTGTFPTLNDPAITSLQSTANNTAPVAKGLNPAHGQPGHRCDIPVGQPLSSSTAKLQTSTTTPSIIPDNTTDTLFAKGLNPAHGKPGHRCDIAVGQPLTLALKKDTVFNAEN